MELHLQRVCPCKCMCVSSKTLPVLMVYSLSLSLSLILSSAPALSSFPLSRARALNEAGGQRQCAANWPSLPGAPAACDWSVQWGPTVQPPLHPSLFHSNRQDARCTPVCLSLVSSPWGHFIFTHIPSTLSSFIFILCHVHTTKGLDLLWITCLTCHYMFLLLNIYLLCLRFSDVSPLSLLVFFFYY